MQVTTLTYGLMNHLSPNKVSIYSERSVSMYGHTSSVVWNFVMFATASGMKYPAISGHELVLVSGVCKCDHM